MSTEPVRLWSIGSVAVIDIHTANAPSGVAEREFDRAADEVLRAFDPPLCAIGIQSGEVGSTLLGLIIRFRARAEVLGGALAIYKLPLQIRQVFTLTRLDREINLTPTLQEAIIALQGQP